MRMKLVGGNWKMNLTKDQATSLCKRLKEQEVDDDVKLAVYVPAIHIPLCQQHLGDVYHIGAQNCYTEQSGAYTGEISPKIIKSYGCTSVLVGHSERRNFFNESNEFLKQKVDACIAEDLHVLFCLGENLDQRESGKAKEVVKQQLQESLFHLSEKEFARISIAYEPVWAIGTGKAASPAQAQEMHHFIRETIQNHYSNEAAKTTSIVYGGSVKPNNAETIFAENDIDGGLIGGASLKGEDFLEIASSL